MAGGQYWTPISSHGGHSCAPNHRRVVDVPPVRLPARVESEPEVVVRHAEIAARTDDAIMYHQGR